MADTLTTSLQFIQQTNTENPGTWGDNVDTNWERAEQSIAGGLSLAVTGAADVTLTSAQARNAVLLFTGTLTANQIIIVSAVQKNWDVINSTSGSFALTVKTVSGTGIAVPQGGTKSLTCDGTNVIDRSPIASFPISDTNSIVRDQADNTKQMRLDAGNVGAGQTRVLFMPDRDVDLDAIANADLATMAQSTVKGRASGAGTGDTQDLSAAQVRTIINAEDGATADQTDAEIKTAYENNANTNSFTDAEQTKLTGIETGADVTDTANVAAATAVMDGDFSASDGQMIKTGVGAYSLVKINRAGTAAPTVNNDVSEGYGVGSSWVDTTNDRAYICLDNADGAAVWTETTAGAAGGETNTTSNTGTVGIGIFKQKSGVDFELYKINSTSTNLTVALNGTDRIDITVPDASATARGAVELATQAESETATDTARAVTPQGLANYARRNANNTYTAAQRGSITTLSDGATITPNMENNNFFTVTLGGNRTLANPTNKVAGQSGSIFLVQDGTGSRTLAYGTDWDFPGGIAPILTTAANAVDRLDYLVRTTGSIHAVLSSDIK